MPRIEQKPPGESSILAPSSPSSPEFSSLYERSPPYYNNVLVKQIINRRWLFVLCRGSVPLAFSIWHTSWELNYNSPVLRPFDVEQASANRNMYIYTRFFLSNFLCAERKKCASRSFPSNLLLALEICISDTWDSSCLYSREVVPQTYFSRHL